VNNSIISDTVYLYWLVNLAIYLHLHLRILTQNSFDIVAVFGNKVERCFDIVAGVDAV